MVLRKVLIANHGEIAVRIIRACRELEIDTVAVYSDADAGALHVRMVDEAVRIGPPPASRSYLNTEAILAAARETGTDAIRPGYGFLSENAAFAAACRSHGITFIGPTPEVTRQMGDKAEARRRAQEAGIPVIPGTPGAVSAADADEAARRIGYPIMIKAAAGGGRRGIRTAAKHAGRRAGGKRGVW